MKKDRSLFSKIVILLIIIIFAFAVFKSVKHNINISEIDKYRKNIVKYTEILDKYAYGNYENDYEKINNESNKVIISKKTSKINKLENEYKSLTEKVQEVAPSEIEGYYNEVCALDLSSLSDKDKNQITKDIGYLRKLIDKKYYKISYNETVRIKNEVKKDLEKQKKIQEKNSKIANDNNNIQNSANDTNVNTINDNSENNTSNTQ